MHYICYGFCGNCAEYVDFNPIWLVTLCRTILSYFSFAPPPFQRVSKTSSLVPCSNRVCSSARASLC